MAAYASEKPARWFDASWMLDQLGDAVVAADAGGTIRFANTAACKLLGFQLDVLVGLPLTSIVPERLRSDHLAGFGRLQATGRARLAGGPPIRVGALRADGTEVGIELTLVVEHVGDPERFVAVAVLRDAGDRIALEREIDLARYLRASVEVAGRLQRAGSVDEAYAEVLPALCGGLDWELASIWHPDGGGTLMCRETWHCGGSDLDAFAQSTRTTSLHLGTGLPGRCFDEGEPVWHEDVTALPSFPRRAAARAAGLHTGVAFPLLGKSGVLAVVELFSRDVRTVDEDLCRLLGTIGRQLGQFLERMQVEADLRYRAALLASQYESMSDGILVVSPDRRVLAYNRRFHELFGTTEREVYVGAPSPAYIATFAERIVDVDGARARIEHAHATRDAVVETEIELTDGRVLEVHGAPVVDTEGTYHGRAWYWRDVTERHRSMRALRSLAETLQRSLLPPHLPAVPGLDLAWLYQAGGEGLEVGGDFYDVFSVGPGAWGFIIGDVCGKGAEAATVTALARYTARAEAMHVRSPAKVLSMVNGALLRDATEAPFLTAAYLTLEASSGGFSCSLASAGHPLPLVVDRSGRVEQLGQAGTLLGVLGEVELPETARRIVQGDVVVLFTDGVTEARDGQGREFGVQRLAEVLRGRAGQSAQSIVDAIEAAISGHLGHPPRDDVAVVVVRVV